jgi:hypothetical protein
MYKNRNSDGSLNLCGKKLASARKRMIPKHLSAHWQTVCNWPGLTWIKRDSKNRSRKTLCH